MTRITLDDLRQFTVSRMGTVSNGLLTDGGAFDQIKSVRKGRGQKDSLPEGATFVRIKKDGWDHEHCKLCWEKIGHGGCEHGYQVSETNGFAKSVTRNMLSIDPLGLLTSAAELITNY